MADDSILFVDDHGLIRFSQAMFSNLQPITMVYGPSPNTIQNYEVLQQRLAKYYRAIIKMDEDGSSYFRAFSHQIWNTQAHHLFVRFATLAYMRENPKSYEATFSKIYCRKTLFDYLDDLAVPNDRGHFPPPGELVMRASCDLFSVNLERLFSYGDRIIHEISPLTHQYHKEVSMSFISTHADSMFLANSVPQPDLGPISAQRMNEIRNSGFFCFQDLIGSRRFPCKFEV